MMRKMRSFLISWQGVGSVLVHFYCCTACAAQLGRDFDKIQVNKSVWFELNCVVAFVFLFFFPRSKHFLRLYPLLTESVPPHCSPGAKDSRGAEVSPVFLPRPSQDVHRQCSTSRLTKSHFCKEFTLHTSIFPVVLRQGGV